MLRRNFLKIISPIIALVTAQDLLAKTAPANNKVDQNSDERTHTVYLKKIGSNTISLEEKKLIKDLNYDFLQSGKMLSFAHKPCEIKNERQNGFKTIYTFRSTSDKADYLNKKEVLIKNFQNNKNRSQS